MRPAEVWGWYRYPFSSRSLMVLRIVAGESPSCSRLAMVRLAAGSAVWTYDSMTAPSTCRSRSVRGVGVFISVKLFHTNNLRGRGVRGQGTNQLIEPEPAFSGAADPASADLDPAGPHPVGRSDSWTESACRIV